MARFEADQVDVAWGIYPGRGRGWVHVEDGTFVLDGFTDLANETFVLRREVEVVREHVWLKHGIEVHVTGADRDGVAVAVDDMVDGINALPPRVPCEALLFEPAPDAPAPDPAGAVLVEPEHSTPRSSTLSLHAVPGGPRLTKLRTKEEQLPLLLEVVERKDAWTRVRFETERARFDVWSPTSEIDAETGSMLGFSGLGCGGIGIGAGPNPTYIKQRTRVVIGTLPFGSPSNGLSLVEGAAVHVVSRRGPFVEIEPAYSSIVPPEGKKFWVAASAVEGDLADAATAPCFDCLVRTRLGATLLWVFGCAEVRLDDGTSAATASNGGTSGASTSESVGADASSSSGATGGAGGAGAGGTGGEGGQLACGNGSLEPGEECDDGGVAAGDGCGADCIVECEPVDPDLAYERVWKNPTTFHCYRVVGGELGGDPQQPCIVTQYPMILDDCLAWGGDAAALGTVEELDEVLASPLWAGGFYEVQIGAQDVTGMGDWIWHDGEPWIYAPGMPPWGAGEPAGGAFLELWVYGDSSGLNADVDGSACGYLCERSPPM
jgi:cysteine-rich repeat protein